MSDFIDDRPDGPDGLTPFEFALAGVTPPGAESMSSLEVIDDMRTLLDGIDEPPVTHQGLREFLDSGGLVARRRERRSRRRHTAARIAERAGHGSFIDITPSDMGGPAADREHHGHEEADDREVAMAATMGSAETTEAATRAEDADDAAIPEPTGPAAPTDAEQSVPRQEPIDAVQADLRSVLVQPDPLVDDVGGDLADALVTGPIAGHHLEELAAATVAEVIDESADGEGGADDAAALAQEPTVADGSDDTGVDDAGATEAANVASTTDRLRDHLGRFGPAFGPELDPAAAALIGAASSTVSDENPTSSDEDSTTTAAMPAAAAAAVAATAEAGPTGDAESPVAVSLFGSGDEPTVTSTDDVDGHGVVALAAGGAAPALLGTTSAAPPLTAPAQGATTRGAAVASAGRRPAGTILALVGAGAAAAVLVAGSLWWATSNASSSTETENADSEVAAAPSTSAEVAAGSLSSPAERSTGDDDEPAEFQGDDEPSSTSSRSTIRATTGPATTGATASGPTVTAAGSGTTGDATGGTATIGGVSTTPTTSTTSTTRPSSTNRPTTTAPPTTRATITTIRPATTTTVAPERPVFIGDRVTVGDYDGPGLGGVEVGLYIDEDSDGRVERRIARRTTTSDGRYSFDEAPGCYEVRFTAPAGYRIRSDLSRQYLCLTSGAVAARTDAIAEQLTSAPPSGCLVEEAGNYAGLGVEVYENASNWASSYTFYSRSGSVVVRTRNLGPFDTDDGDPTDREWFGAENGFNHRSVWSVAAERNGIESTRITCNRDD